MITLENILRNYFDCEVPFHENGMPTKSGTKAAGKLIMLLQDCEDLGLCTGVSNGEEEIRNATNPEFDTEDSFQPEGKTKTSNEPCSLPANASFKLLVKNINYRHSSETILFNQKMFKIEARNGNSYSDLHIYAYTLNGDIALVATKFDIPNYKEMDYMKKEDERLNDCLYNIGVAEDYIRKVWSE